MSSTTLTTTTTTTAITPPTTSTKKHLRRSINQRQQTPPRTVRKSTSFAALPTNSASTPNLNTLYNSHSRLAAPPVPPINHAALARKTSLVALTSSSLAAIPDDTDSYAYNTVAVKDSLERKMAPVTPGRASGVGLGGDDLVVGDPVEVPGNMHGTVRFIGPVQGKKGTFVGVELHPDFAQRGKNSGDVEGVSYFTTNIAGAGIFLPQAKAVRKDDATPTAGSSIAFNPSGSTMGLKAGNQNSTNSTPPTPSVPKFSQSVGPGRAPSPQLKRSRPSLPRPESPVRRLMTPGPRPSIGPGPSSPAPKPPSRYGSPTTSRFAQSVRGTAGDPNKKGKLERNPILGPRSASALGQHSTASGLSDEDSTPVGGVQRNKQANGSIGSVSSLGSKFRPPSRAARGGGGGGGGNDEENEKLRRQLEERDRQLKEQATTLADMESSLNELQALMDGDGLRDKRNSFDDKDSAQLRNMLREKNEKIAMLTAEFDAHRADFRSTIDTLEMASTETERVYEKRIEELQEEIRELQSRTDDVDSVALQLKQLEELVQELEEGLEDARRGEAEARGEVEHLRGEVERKTAELVREKEKASKSPDAAAPAATANGGGMVSSKEFEQKEDEIRGLKAIIHSLSRDSVPGNDVGGGGSERPQLTSRAGSYNSNKMSRPDSSEARIIREKMEKEMKDLRSMVDDQNRREEELQRELESMRRSSFSHGGPGARGSTHRSSFRDSRDTVVLARNRDSRSPEALKKFPQQPRGALDAMAESDAYSNATEQSTLWCEICETGGHDVLTCTEMFGDQGAKNNSTANDGGLRPLPTGSELDQPAPLSPGPKPNKSPEATPTTHIMPNPLESGPVAGKSSGAVDESKWCALCERDGHDSVDCPFEDAF